MRIVSGFSKYRIVIVAVILLLSFLHVAAQDLTPEQYFGDSYSEAVTYIQNQRVDFDSIFSNYKIAPNEAIAVVFPEIIRYNRFCDFAETTLLEVAYTQGGKDIADFSIGRFQMKPSFVELIEHDLLNYNELLQQFKEVVDYAPNLSNDFIRSERIERLKQKSWQLKYLACFIRLAEKRYAKELSQKPQERLLILSSAYNMGLLASYDDLIMLAEKKTFPYGPKIKGRFSYYDVANYYFNHIVRPTQNSKP